SGSTGLPKAVLLSHRNLASRCSAMIDRYDIDATQRVPLFISLSFDASAEEIYPTLAAGGILVLPPDPVSASIFSWLDACGKLDANTLHLPASYWSRMLLELETAARMLPQWLHLCIVGGESLDPGAVLRWFRLNPGRARLFNAYGPTEATITAAACDLRPSLAGHPPIGRPLHGTTMYLLDQRLELIPAGACGELVIGGQGVARGYGNRPELTAQQFIPDPFSAEPGGRLYRTGDRARLSSEGEFEFLGRADRQIKIRGFRVDLDEIESLLQQHPDVLEAAVVMSGAGLVAYVSFQSGAASVDLTNYLILRLPEHMLPERMERLDRLPRTIGGKINYRELPEVSASPDPFPPAPSPSNGPYLDILIGVCRELAGHTLVDGDDSFFEMGGNSLLAIQLASRIRTVFGAEVSLQSIFEAPSLSSLAKTIAQSNASQASHLPAIEPKPREQGCPATFAQESIWRAYRAFGNSYLNHVVQTLHFQGALNSEALEQSLLHLVRRHEALRTTFYEEDGSLRQRILQQSELELGLWDLSRLSPEKLPEQTQAVVQREVCEPFDLFHGPPFHAVLLRLDEDAHLLVLSTHHIIADGWSMRLLTGELAACYAAYSTGTLPRLPELPVQFADFAHWERACFRDGLFESDLTYWRRQLAGAQHDLHFAENGTAFEPSSEMAQESVKISTEASHRLSQWAQAEHSTPFIALCTAWKMLLRDYSATGMVSLCTLAANRTRSETEGVFGLFLNTIILRTDLSGENSFREAARKVRATALAAYAHQSLPFEVMLRDLEREHRVNRSSLSRALFVFENTEDAQSDANGVQIFPGALEAGGATAVSQATTFDLVLAAAQGPEGIQVVLRYRADQFERGAIQGQLKDLTALIESVMTDSHRSPVRRPISTHSLK
ncbi:MAG: condensation domain-containing protein, partial [Candidatus Solibacter sp.]